MSVATAAPPTTSATYAQRVAFVSEIASRLQGIYAFCRRHLIEAAAQQDPDKIDEVSELLTELREAWAEIAGSES